jgi:hypothetical protein
MNNVEPNYRSANIGKEILNLADLLVDARNMEGLEKLSDVVTGLILANVIDAEKVSLIEVNEYIGLAIESIEKNLPIEEIKSSSIRKLLG